MAETVAHPPVVSEAEWRKARVTLLAHEKELTKHYDRVNAERRRLPMVKIGKTYAFDTPDGKKSLADLFKGKRQLVVYHFMFGPDWEKGCPGCTWFASALGDLTKLTDRDTNFVMISRGPLEKLLAYKKEHGWKQDWVSSLGSDFNYDFHVTLDDAVTPREYNYLSGPELDAKNGRPVTGESHGISVFFCIGDDIFHTYSTYGRGTETHMDAYTLLDLTPYGRQQDFEESPAGFPQKPTYG
jgi:predicted dithiol-disulfide oxidoreductase (DUF899 family)